jgi:hypothetical protein
MISFKDIVEGIVDIFVSLFVLLWFVFLFVYCPVAMLLSIKGDLT